MSFSRIALMMGRAIPWQFPETNLKGRHDSASLVVVRIALDGTLPQYEEYLQELTIGVRRIQRLLLADRGSFSCFRDDIMGGICLKNDLMAHGLRIGFLYYQWLMRRRRLVSQLLVDGVALNSHRGAQHSGPRPGQDGRAGAATMWRPCRYGREIVYEED